ncbi:MAG: AGE family epimerase/isomerase [Ignavibacteriaceae bacterium]|jgi:mannobiose 2-epimerase
MLSFKKNADNSTDEKIIFNEMLEAVRENLFDKWYPLAIDKENGGYYTDITYNFEIDPEQHKMIVTQGRQIWTASKAAIMFDNNIYGEVARHGHPSLKKLMWDNKTGGFYQMRDPNGQQSDYLGFRDEKRTYGNAFAIYGLAALYEFTKDQDVLEFAKKAFNWIEDRAFDPKLKGYFQFIDDEGRPFNKESAYKTQAYDAIELGYKDQNSSIHLLEAYTELYHVWKDEKLKKQLTGLLTLIRDVITTPKGHMNLFFHNDWTPVSFKSAAKDVREKNYRLDHVSFGHDYETGFLMLETSYELGLQNDVKTLTTAKKMLDHAIANGWDQENGGFWDAGYYFEGEEKITIIQQTKNWWAQAEGLNALLLMSKIFPDEKNYNEYFIKQWNYIKKYLLDYENGDWFEGGLDKEPHFKIGPKGHIWKAAYHTGRALMNCLKILAKDDPEYGLKNEGFIKTVKHFNDFVEHWNKVAGELKK